MADTKTVFYGTGRRKRSIARVRLVEGNGTITVNGKDLNDYFGAETLKYIVRQPLSVTETSSKYDVICTVKGGGFTGQAGAIRHGISRALLEANSDEFRPTLKSNGFLTRDSRMKERKKYGLKKARKAPQRDNKKALCFKQKNIKKETLFSIGNTEFLLFYIALLKLVKSIKFQLLIYTSYLFLNNYLLNMNTNQNNQVFLVIHNFLHMYQL